MKEETKQQLDALPEASEEMVSSSKPYEHEYGRAEMHLFAMKKTIQRKGNRIFGQWQPSYGRACRGAPTTDIEYGAILNITEAGECAESGAIVMDYVLL